MKHAHDPGQGAMTPAKAEVLTQLSADLTQVIFNTVYAHPGLDLINIATATTLALRGLAAQLCANNPALSLEVAKEMLRHAFDTAMGFPDEILRVLDDPAGSGPHQAGIIPVRRH